MEAKSNSRLSSSATAGLGHGHKHKDEASELVSDGGGHFFKMLPEVPDLGAKTCVAKEH